MGLGCGSRLRVEGGAAILISLCPGTVTRRGNHFGKCLVLARKKSLHPRSTNQLGFFSLPGPGQVSGPWVSWKPSRYKLQGGLPEFGFPVSFCSGFGISVLDGVGVMFACVNATESIVKRLRRRVRRARFRAQRSRYLSGVGLRSTNAHERDTNSTSSAQDEPRLRIHHHHFHLGPHPKLN
jgi:hypothetical protein